MALGSVGLIHESDQLYIGNPSFLLDWRVRLKSSVMDPKSNVQNQSLNNIVTNNFFFLAANSMNIFSQAELQETKLYKLITKKQLYLLILSH